MNLIFEVILSLTEKYFLIQMLKIARKIDLFKLLVIEINSFLK